MSGGERDKRVCARGGKVGGKKTLEPSFPILQLRRTKLGLTESRHATPRVYTHTHVHTDGRAYSIPYLISLPSGIYISPRWPPTDVPFNAAKMPEEKFLVASRQRFSSDILARPGLFSSIPCGNTAGISDRPILYDYYYRRSQPGNPHFHEPP